MPRQNRVVEGLIPGSCKIRKRGCSSSSSSSSVVQNYRFKRAILVGKSRGSRSSTPASTWRITAALRAAAPAAESPKYAPSQSGGGGRSRPVSARKLAATLWEMNEIPSPRVVEDHEERRSVRREREMRSRDRMGAARSVHSGSLPPHLSDPSHSPVSEKMDRSGTCSRRRSSSITHRLRIADHNAGVLDSVSSASLMEIETRSRVQTPRGSVAGGRTRLKDVSSALTTSKELLKIINRIWARDDQPSSSMSLISALHAELERARLQVNQLIQEDRSDQNEISYLMKCFAEERAAWKSKEQKVVEAAIESVVGELEIERKLRRRLESLNKKLGKELADTKAALMKAVKELKSEKSAREIMEQVCDDLARDFGEDKAEFEELKRESAEIHEDVSKEREMLQLTDILHDERIQMKLSGPKSQFEEKNEALDKLRKQLEGFMRTKSGKEKGHRTLSRGNSEDIAAYLSRTRFGTPHENEIIEANGEVEDGVDCENENPAENDLHSIELNLDNKNYKRNFRRAPVDDEIKGRKSTSGKPPRRSTSLRSDFIENLVDGLDQESLYELEKQAQRKSFVDDVLGYKMLKGRRDQMLSTTGGSARDFASPSRQAQFGGLTSRLAEIRGEGQTERRSRR
ncbi:hypothetical protein NMG60_11008553 [Bertholletia excelsa]